jgi:hypothetical protein
MVFLISQCSNFRLPSSALISCENQIFIPHKLVPGYVHCNAIQLDAYVVVPTKNYKVRSILITSLLLAVALLKYFHSES